MIDYGLLADIYLLMLRHSRSRYNEVQCILNSLLVKKMLVTKVCLVMENRAGSSLCLNT